MLLMFLAVDWLIPAENIKSPASRFLFLISRCIPFMSASPFYNKHRGTNSVLFKKFFNINDYFFPVFIWQCIKHAVNLVRLVFTQALLSKLICTIKNQAVGSGSFLQLFSNLFISYPWLLLDRALSFKVLYASYILNIDPNKNRTEQWLQLLRLQLPANVTHYGSIGTVTYYAPNVNNDTNVAKSCRVYI